MKRSAPLTSLAKDFSSGPDFVYQTHGLSSKEAHRLDVSGCVDFRRHTGEPLNRYLCTTRNVRPMMGSSDQESWVSLSRSTHSLTNRVLNVRWGEHGMFQKTAVRRLGVDGVTLTSDLRFIRRRSQRCYTSLRLGALARSSR